MKTLRAIDDFPYANKCYKRGDVFDIDEESAEKLIIIGKAEWVGPSNSYEHRALEAGAEDKPTTQRGRYARRDMRANK